MAESLREACATGNIKAVEYYLSQGVNVNSANKVNGFTPLHWANSRGHDDIIAMLIMNGADPTLKDSKGRLPGDIYNPKPFQNVPKPPSYIEQPDLQKLWGVPSQQQQSESVAVVESGPTLARLKSEKASVHGSASTNESAANSPSASSTLSRRVSFKGELYDHDAEGAAETRVNQSAEQIARTASPDHGVGTSSSSRSGSVEWDEGKKMSSSKRSSFRRSVSFLDADVAEATTLVVSGSAASSGNTASSAPEGSIGKLPSVVKKTALQDAEGEPSKTIDGSMKRSSSNKPLNQTMAAPNPEDKNMLTEVMVFRDFKSQISLRGSIFISAETTLLGLYNQLLHEIDDMPADFILQKERDGLYIPINRAQLTQSAAVHFRNSNLIYTSDISRNI